MTVGDEQLVEARANLRTQVDAVLAKLAGGELPSTVEREQVDLKEEPGRRGPGGSVLPGERQSTATVELLAREVPCMANTPGGGALVFGLDVMAAATERTVDDVSTGALLVARRYLAVSDPDEYGDIRDLPSHELLRRLGVLRPDGALTQAGVLVFCSAPRALIELSRLDVVGGDVLNAPVDFAGRALLEQLVAVEDRLDAFNTARTVRRGLAETLIRGLPPRAVREAILNGLIHRDWMQPEPITVTWFEHDNALEVISPGGFVGGVTAANVLTQRYARYPALSDLFRALRLVDKQGIGVDRMYREMIVLGHRPPIITEQPGPQVRTRLVGGDPVVPVMALVGAIMPEHRRRDARLAIVIHRLLHEPFLTVADAAAALQSSETDAVEALDLAAGATVHGAALVTSYKDVWLLSPAAVAEVERAGEPAATLRRRGLLRYRRPDPAEAVEVVRRWLASHDRITTGDYASLTGLTQPGALKTLDRMARDGLLQRGDAHGRNAHYLLRAAR